MRYETATKDKKEYIWHSSYRCFRDTHIYIWSKRKQSSDERGLPYITPSHKTHLSNTNKQSKPQFEKSNGSKMLLEILSIYEVHHINIKAT